MEQPTYIARGDIAVFIVCLVIAACWALGYSTTASLPSGYGMTACLSTASISSGSMPEGLSEVIPPLIVSKRSINCPKEFKEFPLYPHSTPPGYQLVPIEQGEQFKKLIDAVEQKFPNESRFETALRYIRESAVERKPVVAVKEK